MTSPADIQYLKDTLTNLRKGILEQRDKVRAVLYGPLEEVMKLPRFHGIKASDFDHPCQIDGDAVSTTRIDRTYGARISSPLRTRAEETRAQYEKVKGICEKVAACLETPCEVDWLLTVVGCGCARDQMVERVSVRVHFTWDDHTYTREYLLGR